jgi:pSer/pThr/pTyr-binding forkhead associated (FHA) protein
MKARLFCKTGQLAGASFEIEHEATIGKSAGNTIQLYPTLISGKHARIFYDERAQSYFVEDLGSRNGTRLDGVRVKGKERLGALNVITFSNTFDFLFQVVGAEQALQAMKPVARTPSVEKPLPPKPLTQERKTQFDDGFAPLPVPPPSVVEPARQPDKQKTVFDDGAFVVPSLEDGESTPVENVQRTKVGVEFTPVPSFVEPSKPPQSGAAARNVLQDFVLVFDSLKGGPMAFDIKEGSTVIGRDASCTIAVDDGSMSRRHAELDLKGGTLTLRDLGSKNHTYINDQKISQEVEVKEGMKLTFGLVKARLIRKPSK